MKRKPQEMFFVLISPIDANKQKLCPDHMRAFNFVLSRRIAHESLHDSDERAKDLLRKALKSKKMQRAWIGRGPIVLLVAKDEGGNEVVLRGALCPGRKWMVASLRRIEGTTNTTEDELQMASAP